MKRINIDLYVEIIEELSTNISFIMEHYSIHTLHDLNRVAHSNIMEGCALNAFDIISIRVS